VILHGHFRDDFPRVPVSLPARQREIATCTVLVSGYPLIGTELLREHFLKIELTDGGEVTIEPLWRTPQIVLLVQTNRIRHEELSQFFEGYCI